MMEDPSQTSLTQRTGFALAEALRHARGADPVPPNGQIRAVDDLLIDGVQHEQLPTSIDPSRLRSAQSAAALAINTFLPWQRARDRLPLAGWTGFDAIQFEVRCPTGLRGTPPHLDLLAVRAEVAVAVTVRCTEYLSRRKTAVAASYDRLLAMTPGLDPWRRQLERLRHEPGRHRHLDLGALIKFALALGRTFPERPATLVYLYWEPLNADEFAEFCRHRAEVVEVAKAVADARVTMDGLSLEAMWREWAALNTPEWLPGHLDRLRARYSVSIAAGGRL
jgi:hypothetical protein